MSSSSSLLLLLFIIIMMSSLKVVKSSNSVIHNMFWAYLGSNAGKDKLCTCIFNGRNVVFANIYDDFMAQQV